MVSSTLLSGPGCTCTLCSLEGTVTPEWQRTNLRTAGWLSFCVIIGPHLGAGPTGWGWLARGALLHMLAVWKGGKHSSAGAREIGNVMSAYSPHPGLIPLSERERDGPGQKTTKAQGPSSSLWQKEKYAKQNVMKGNTVHINTLSSLLSSQGALKFPLALLWWDTGQHH